MGLIPFPLAIELTQPANFKPFLISFVILLAPFILYKLERKNARKELLLTKINPAETIMQAFALFAVIFIILLTQGLFLNAIGLLDNYKVAQLISVQNPFVLFLAVTIGPIGEELLFRGYFLKKIGLGLQALLFAILHYAYGSFSEILAALLIGLALGIFLKQEKNIYACILAHSLYNLFSILTVFSLSNAGM